MYQEVDIHDIFVDPSQNYRQTIDSAGIKELCASFLSVYQLSNGARWMLNPVDVVRCATPVDGKQYRLCVGFRRYFAAQYGLQDAEKKHAFMAKIPVYVREATYDTDKVAELVLALVENLQRHDVPPLEEATAIQHALSLTGDTASALADRLGKTPGWVSQRLALLKLAPEVQAAMHAGSITFSHARALGRLPEEDQSEVLAQHLESNWGVSQLDECVREILSAEAGAGSAPGPEEEVVAPGDVVKTQAFRLRDAELLRQEVEALTARVEYAREWKTGATDTRKTRLEREEAFYAGAQSGIEWAIGQKTEIKFKPADFGIFQGFGYEEDDGDEE